MQSKVKSKVIGCKFKNLVTGNCYKCVAYDGNVLTLEGIGNVITFFDIPWWLVLLKYREIK